MDLLADVGHHPFPNPGDQIETAGGCHGQDGDDREQQLETLADEDTVLFGETGLQYLPGGDGQDERGHGSRQKGKGGQGQQDGVGFQITGEPPQGPHVAARGSGFGKIGWRLHRRLAIRKRVPPVQWHPFMTPGVYRYTLTITTPLGSR